MDLKALLIEAKQKVPPVLQVLQTGDETMLDIGGTNYVFIAETSLCSQLNTCPKWLQHYCTRGSAVLKIYLPFIFPS